MVHLVKMSYKLKKIKISKTNKMKFFTNLDLNKISTTVLSKPFSRAKMRWYIKNSKDSVTLKTRF